jgi:hypothetical protein
MTGKAVDPIKRILENVEIIPESGCWIWMGTTNQSGYGIMSHNGKVKTVHRVSWAVHNEKMIPEGMCVCHKCDVRTCANPSHLFIGSHKDNSQDMSRKGRAKNQNSLRDVCHKGHLLDEANTYTYPSGKRKCKTCRATQEKVRYYQLKQESSA